MAPRSIPVSSFREKYVTNNISQVKTSFPGKNSCRPQLAGNLSDFLLAWRIENIYFPRSLLTALACNLSKPLPWCSMRRPIRRTMLTTTPNPEARRGVRFLSGKCGSIMPVTGFRSVVGANAAYVGRGRSCDKKGAKTLRGSTLLHTWWPYGVLFAAGTKYQIQK